jgi:sigma-B regulation protein RsbQ
MTNIVQRNNVNVTGNGGTQTIVFAHGFGCSQNAWKRITSAFTADYKLVLFDYVGAGKSDVTAYDKERYNNLEGYAEDIIEICHGLNIKDAVFVGHSVSAMIGALASIKQPTLFKKLIFIAPSASYINEPGYTGGFEREDIESLLELMDEDYIGWTKLLSPKLIGNVERTDLTNEMEDNFCSTDHEIVKQFAKITFLTDNRKDLPNIPVASLTLQCSDDMIAPLEVGEYIRDHTPNNTLIVLKATGHCPHMSAPEEIVEAIRSFL